MSLCKYKTKCLFAHDEFELRTPEQNSVNYGWDNYKSQICRNYQNGTCSFGEQCTFLHVTIEDLERRLPIFKSFTNILIEF
jgi:hypothetical protein